MAKAYSRFVCQVCGKVSSQAFGRCPACDSWDSMVEELVEPEHSHSARAVRGLNASSQPRRLADIEGEREERVPVRMKSFRGSWAGGLFRGPSS